MSVLARARRSSPAMQMAAGTVASRATGFARTAALAAVLGLTTTADAYNAAASIPTMLLVLVTGGTLSAAAVPLIARPDSLEERRAAAASVLIAVTVVTAAATVVVALLSQPLAQLLSAAAGSRREQRADLTAVLLLLFAPQVLLLGVSVAANAVLTAAGRLGRVGITPVLTNVFAIAAVGAYALSEPGGAPQRVSTGLVLLGAGTTAGVAAMTFAQLWGCRDLLPPLRAVRGSVDRSVLRSLRAVGRWSAVYVVANQLGLLFVIVVAGASAGALSAYQWGFAVMQLPYAIVAVSVLSARFPALTRAADDEARFSGILAGTAARLLRLLVPCAAALVVFADVAAAVLLGFGAASADVARLTLAIRLFGLALVPFSLFQLMTRASYALQQPRDPALVNILVNVVTVVGAAGALTVGRPHLLSWLVTAYAFSYVAGCIGMAVALGRHVDRSVVGGAATAFRRAALPAAAAAGIAWVARLLLPAPWGLGVAAVLFTALLAPVLLARRSASTGPASSEQGEDEAAERRRR